MQRPIAERLKTDSPEQFVESLTDEQQTAVVMLADQCKRLRRVVFASLLMAAQAPIVSTLADGAPTSLLSTERVIAVIAGVTALASILLLAWAVRQGKRDLLDLGFPQTFANGVVTCSFWGHRLARLFTRE
jgi:hypothetical protein